MAIIDLCKSQYEIVKSDASIRMLVAARGFGKSTTILADALLNSLNFPYTSRNNLEALIIAPTIPQVRTNFWENLVSLCGDLHPAPRINHSRMSIKFSNNVTLSLNSFQNGGERLRGKNLIYCAIDEGQETNLDLITTIILPAFRSKDTPVNLLIAGTPKGIASPFYTIKKWVDANPSYKYYHRICTDRTSYPLEMFEQARKDLPPRVFNQEYLASWETAPGSFFDNFSDVNILSDCYFVGEEFEYYLLSNDNGSSNPAATLIGVTGDKYYLVDEWRTSGDRTVTVEEVIQANLSLVEKTNGKRVQLLVSDDRLDIVHSLRTYGIQKGIKPLTKTVGVRRSKPGPVARASILDTLFYQQKLFVNARLTDTINEIKSYHRAKNSAGEYIDVVAPAQKDHLIDSLSYGVCWDYSGRSRGV